MPSRRCVLSGPDRCLTQGSCHSCGGGGRREGVAGGTIIAHAVQFLRRKLRPREGHHPPHSHMTGPQRGGGTEDRVCFPPPPPGQPPCTSHPQAGDSKRQEGKGSRPGFLEAGGSFKARACRQSASFPWKQPVGQLVPVSLRPGGASAPDRLQELAGSLVGGGTQEPRALLESLSCLLSASGVCFEGNVREWLIPASASPVDLLRCGLRHSLGGPASWWGYP